MTRLTAHMTHLPSTILIGLGVILLAGSAAVCAEEESAGDHYAQVLADADSLARHNDILKKQVQAQESLVVTIQQQITNIDATAEAIPALVQRLFESLKAFVASDLPFTDPTGAGPDSRSERIAKIQDLMGNEEISNGERYRRLLEAYQIELDYGRNMVAYKAKLADGRDADFVRVGRVSLLYRTADGKEAGYWDKQQKKWVADNQYNEVIKRAILIAAKEVAPDLVTLPVPAPEEVRM